MGGHRPVAPMARIGVGRFGVGLRWSAGPGLQARRM